jgi:hypothetical protein
MGFPTELRPEDMADEEPVESLRAGRFSNSTGEDTNRRGMVDDDDGGKSPLVDFPKPEPRSTPAVPSRSLLLGGREGASAEENWSNMLVKEPVPMRDNLGNSSDVKSLSWEAEAAWVND